MKQIKLEDTEGQNMETWFKYYDNGAGCIENRFLDDRTHKAYLNKQTTQELWQHFNESKIINIRAANWITNLLIKLNIVQITLEVEYESKTDN